MIAHYTLRMQSITTNVYFLHVHVMYVGVDVKCYGLQRTFIPKA